MNSESTKTDATYQEALDAVTGFDEDEIYNRFGLDMYGTDLTMRQRMQYQRAVVFTHLHHSGATYEDAFVKAMGMNQAEVLGYFAPSTDLDDDDPDGDSPAGKGASQPA